MNKHLSVRCFFFQAEDGIRDLVRSRGLGDVYKRQALAVEHLDLLSPPPPWVDKPPSHWLFALFDLALKLSLIHI